MKTLYKDERTYDALYISDDYSRACRVFDLDAMDDVPGVLVEFVTPTFPLHLSQWREFFKASGLRHILKRLRMEYPSREKYKKARADAILLMSLLFGWFDQEDAFVFVPPEDRGDELLKKKGWDKGIDERFDVWDRVMEYIKERLDGEESVR